MATEKQKEVKGKVKKLLLGKKELLIDDEENSVDEQYMFNVDGQQDDIAFDATQKDGLRSYFKKVTWGSQDRNKHKTYNGQAILVHQTMVRRVDILDRAGFGRKWEMVYAKRADQDARGRSQGYMHTGHAIVLRKTNASLDDYRDLVVAAVKAGFTGVEIFPAGSERIAILDARPKSQPGQLYLKLSSGGSRATDLHPVRLLHGEVVYGNDSIILFSSSSYETAGEESGTSGENVSRHFFQLVKKTTGLENFIAEKGRPPFLDELKDMNTRGSASRNPTATGNSTARIKAEQPVTILYSAKVVKKAEEDASAIIQNMTGGRGQTPTATAAPAAQPALAKFSEYNTGDIMKLQEMLNAIYPDLFLTVDGKFGPDTKGALQKFQYENNLTVDGIPGQKTLPTLNRAYNKLTQPAATSTSSTSGTTSTYSGGGATTTYTPGGGGGVGGGDGDNPPPALKPNVFSDAIAKFTNWVKKDDNLNDVVIPASVLLAVGIGGAFAWRKFVKGRENRRLAKRLARDRMVQREMEMLLRQQSVPVDMLRNNRDFMRSMHQMERSESMAGMRGYYGGRY